MSIAIISDIHSNIDALESVLKDIKTRGINDIYSTGDSVEYLPFPNEVIKALKAAEVQSIMGNHDLAAIEKKLPTEAVRATMTEKEIQGGGANIFTIETMTEASVAWIKALPRYRVLSLGGLTIRLVHGGPNNISQYIREHCEDFESIAKEFDEDVLVNGHSHEPYHKQVFGKHFVNAGSVGLPKHGRPNATYVILDVIAGELEVEIVEVPYEKERLIEAIRLEPRIADDLIDRVISGQ